MIENEFQLVKVNGELNIFLNACVYAYEFFPSMSIHSFAVKNMISILTDCSSINNNNEKIITAEIIITLNKEFAF
jgi:hypothetical protein